MKNASYEELLILNEELTKKLKGCEIVIKELRKELKGEIERYYRLKETMNEKS